MWLLCFGKLLDASRVRSGAGWAAATGMCAAGLWAVHGRMLVVVVLTVGVLAALVVLRRLALAPVAVAMLVLACGLLGVHLLTNALVAENYGSGPFDQVARRLSSVDDPHRLVLGARNLVGHAWYLLVSTFGLVLVLLAADWRHAVSRVTRRDADTRDLVLALLLAATAGLLLVSALAFGRALRPDRLVYGRYVEVLAPPLVAVGLVALADWRRRGGRAAVAVLVCLTVVVAGVRAGIDPRWPPVTFNVQSLPFPPGLLGPSRLLGAGLVAAAGLCSLLAVRRRSGWAAAPLLLILFLPTTAFSERSLLAASRDVYPPGWSSPASALAGRNVETIAYDDARADTKGGLIYPWLLSSAVVVRFSSRDDPPPSRYVISSRAWPADHPDRPAEALWEDPVRDQTLWRLVTDPLAAPRALEACLRRAGLAVSRPSARSEASRLAVSLGGGGPVRVTFYATAGVAVSRARDADRFLRMAGRRDAFAIVRRGSAVAVHPATGARSGASALRRCLPRAS